MPIFVLKRWDTLPILEVALTNPDGSAHDLTGATTFTLLVRVTGASILRRDLVLDGLPTAGVLRYTWVATDWADPIIPNDPVLPNLKPGQHRYLAMEYEVVAGSSRMTFPNGQYDTLHLVGDVG